MEEGIEHYKKALQQSVKKCYELAGQARAKNLDPERIVPIPLAENMAERVVGLISVVAPQITNTGITRRIIELENEYGLLDWRVGLVIAEEVAHQKFCTFETAKEAIEVGIRVGFAYLTLGIVSAPLEGFIGIKIKKRKDGAEYFAVQYAGPIRAAGGTAASTSVLLADYVRVKLGYAPYDPEEPEVNRYVTEIHDYHERVTNLQYHPSDEEIKFLASHLPVEVDGEPTEKFEVSNYKDLPRIETNLIRGGMALVMAEGLSQKTPKLWKRLTKWGAEFGLSHWSFLGEFIQLKEKIHAAHAGKEKEEGKNVKPNNTFIMDLVAGRPILTHPLAAGGFRLRYGRTRVSGFSACALHPATLIVVNKYIAIGTQLKTERPGKAATVTVCDVLDGPIVRLQDGTVLQLQTAEDARKHFLLVEEVLFLGDILFNYGDFSENGHPLVPAGYCPEWWVLELEKAVKKGEADAQKSFSPERIQELIHHPFTKPPSFEEAVMLSKTCNIPLHPDFLFYWKLATNEDIIHLRNWLKEGKIKREGKGLFTISKIILPYNPSTELHTRGKKTLDSIGVCHFIINKSTLVIEKKEAMSLVLSLNLEEEITPPSFEKANGLDLVSVLCPLILRDKAGTFIGARMGRPEKAKMRQMTGSPQVMFPVGEEGDRLRSFQSALQAGKIHSTFPFFHCPVCVKDTIYSSCELCGQACIKKYSCRFCGDLVQNTCRHGHGVPYKIIDLDIKHYLDHALGLIGETITPDLIKGVKGTSNKEHLVEHLVKGILRAKHGIYVNKDGTTRYDCTELPITHFKPKEILTPVDTLRKLGYEKDIEGNQLHDEQQILELKPQDIILPAFNSLDESAPQVLMRIARFVDELLVKFYHLEPYYNIQNHLDLVGHLVVGLAPHISAGLIGRIIGFSETQGLLAHPLYHAGMRRDCFHYNTYLPLYDGRQWNIQPLGTIVNGFTEFEVVDSFGTQEVPVKKYRTLGEKGAVVAVKNFTKHTPQPMIHIKTSLGRELTITPNHKQLVSSPSGLHIKKGYDLQKGDILAFPYTFAVPSHNRESINLLDYLEGQEWVMVRNLNTLVPSMKSIVKIHFRKKERDNFFRRDSYPLSFVLHLIKKGILRKDIPLLLAAKGDTVMIPSLIPLTKEFLQVVGLYIAEGFSRKVEGRLYQVYIAAQDEEIRRFIQNTMRSIFGLKSTERKKDGVTYSSRILYYLFTAILRCGSSAYEKRFPSLFLDLPRKKIGYILGGYFEGEGSVSSTDLRVTFDTVSTGLLHDIDFVLNRLGVFVKRYKYTKKPGPVLRKFYERKGRNIPLFTITKGIIPSSFVKAFSRYISFISSRKQSILTALLISKRVGKTHFAYDSHYVYGTIIHKEIKPAEESYCLAVEGNIVVANSILTKQCDGDEACVMLLMDALLNFSRQYLPEKRGAKTMDSPLVLTSILYPSEVDDQVHGLDVVWKYPLELYEASLDMKNPWEVLSNKKKIEQLADRLGTPHQYYDFGFTHPVENFNKGVLCSQYKIAPSMEEKLLGQMDIAKKLRAVDMDDVAKLVIQKHFLKDIKGNLRKFSMQQFRCVKCNEKYRRPPLSDRCTSCKGKLIFTITHGSVIKYLGPSLLLAERYDFSPYLKQTLDILRIQVDTVFGKEKEKQAGLGQFL